ncbi:MAG: isochorismatase family protein [Methylophilaceae bacterium]
MANFLAQSASSQLVILDMQTKLSSVMSAGVMQVVAKNCGILTQAANLLNISVIVSEQYPQGLGETMPEIAQYLDHNKPIVKTAFSAWHAPKFNQQLHRDKPQILLTGMEAHICVLQTALDLLSQGKQVFVIEDAIISRNSENKINAINRLRAEGCVISNTESALFEWLGDANHEAFKALSKLIR